jgi:hypothetical protein
MPPSNDQPEVKEIQAPPARNLAQEAEDTFNVYKKEAPEQYALESEYQPKYAALDTRIMGDTAKSTLDLFESDIYPRTSKLEADAATAQRRADIEDVARFGADSNAAFRSASPVGTKLFDQFSNEAGNGSNMDIETELRRQALEDLQKGGSLTPEEIRLSDQGVARNFSDRGIGKSNPAMFTTALNRVQYSEGRKAQRQSVAQSIDQYVQQSRANRLNLANAATSAETAPLMSIIGKPVTTPGVAQANFTNSSYTQASAPQLGFDPFNAYAQDLYNTNYNAQAAAATATANAQAGVTGAGIASKGQKQGAMIAGGAAIAGAVILAA